ncbi:MAG: hypothetical protein JWQ98_3171 [Chlorobi bacterium]|nr:hypothetical protein [Chlorobiota bacterium]
MNRSRLCLRPAMLALALMLMSIMFVTNYHVAKSQPPPRCPCYSVDLQAAPPCACPLQVIANFAPPCGPWAPPFYNMCGLPGPFPFGGYYTECPGPWPPYNGCALPTFTIVDACGQAVVLQNVPGFCVRFNNINCTPGCCVNICVNWDCNGCPTVTVTPAPCPPPDNAVN